MPRRHASERTPVLIEDRAMHGPMMD